MDNRELLESAARAAGVSGTYVRVHQAFGDQWVEGIDTGALIYWNPLGNDGDAMRLAVKFDISLRQKFAMVQAEYPWIDDEFNTRKVLCEPVLDDHCAASRRVIVRAAAEIGKMVDAPLVRAEEE
jgi:hypothetical protein